MAGSIEVSTTGRVDTLSLAHCHLYDPRPHRSGGYLRFRCPIHDGDKQQSLAVNEATGRFRCHNGACGAWGTVTEHRAVRSETNPEKGVGGGWNAPHQSRQRSGFNATRNRFNATPPVNPVIVPPLVHAQPAERNTLAVNRAKESAKRYLGSAAQEYARRRGIPDELAREHGLGSFKGVWGDCDSEWLTFPTRCPVSGRVVAVYGRNIHSDESKDKGRKLGPLAIFGATGTGPLPADMIAVEGPFEAIACLLSPNLPPARAACGTSWHAEWFDECERVTLLLDDDDAGTSASDKLTREINDRRARRNGCGPRLLCLPPGALQQRYGVKDLGELLARGVVVRLDLPPLPPSFASLPIAPFVDSSFVPDASDASLSDSGEDIVVSKTTSDNDKEVVLCLLEHVRGLYDVSLQAHIDIANGMVCWIEKGFSTHHWTSGYRRDTKTGWTETDS